MSESIDTEAIRAYWRAWVGTPSHTERIRMEPWLARRVPALLDEIGSLRAENAELGSTLALAADDASRIADQRDAAEAKLAAVREARERWIALTDEGKLMYALRYVWDIGAALGEGETDE